jgi:hypothetical protein
LTIVVPTGLTSGLTEVAEVFDAAAIAAAVGLAAAGTEAGFAEGAEGVSSLATITCWALICPTQAAIINNRQEKNLRMKSRRFRQSQSY